ncbi:MAG: hypothetical protein EOO24_57550 [Comamonadaceae bacterium]|nr:MAG: hypothetical protein EOO24_57550 [Comamonadaceae bacterium]
MRRLGGFSLVLLLAACGSKPQAPDWQVGAHGALERYESAYLAGDQRAADAEFARARSQLGATGRADLVARAELTRCALQVASLEFDACPGFEPLRGDAGAAERAYADYLQGLAVPADQLPVQHRAAAGGRADAASLAAVQDPLARLVAAGVLLRSNRASPDVLRVAADTASERGWRRPLAAWLGAQLRLAEQAGATEQAERLRRRLALVTGTR